MEYISNLFNYNITPGQVLLFFLCAMVTGMAKAGLKGIGLAIVPVMALIFGAQESTGILLPVLIMADIMAVIYYRKHAEWRFIIMLLPASIAGIVAGQITGKYISSAQFSIILSSLVVIMLVLMIINDLMKNKYKKIPDGPVFSSLMGIAGGFATMIGNSAGPVFNLYFLAMRMPKKEFIGTAAWFFLIINVIKVPFHIISWHTITPDTIIISLSALPAVAAGIVAGIYLVKLFPEKFYRYFVIATTVISAIALFLK
ncbi:MAG: sulfite exporter TauE/SafE family protein [Bacteroidales bacterium]|nr:sulfite exporter TauE/SafE family protein [Bacteroidales bacterium]